MTHRNAVAIALGLALVGSTARAEGMFEPLPLPASFFPNALSLSSDGSALCGWGTYYWSESTGYLQVPNGFVANISGDGSTCIGTTDASGLERASIWVPGGGWNSIDDLPGGESCGSSMSSGYALNFDGTVGVGLAWVPNCRAEAFKWTSGTGTVGLGRTGTNSSRASDISDDGTTSVGFDEHPDFGYRRPVFWTDDVDGPRLIAGTEPAGEALGVSSDGSRICGVADGFGFYYDANAGLVNIGALPDETWGSTATSVADDGTVVGFSGDPFFSFPAAIIWTAEGGIQKLQERLVAMSVDVAGHYLYTATSISADGRTIAGCAIDPSGNWFVPYVVRLPVSIGGATSATPDIAQVSLNLSAAPNPFAVRTNVSFALPQAARVQVTVIDMNGRQVRTLADGTYGAGRATAAWDGTDANGRAVSSGTYFIRMVGGGQVETQKVSLIR